MAVILDSIVLQQIPGVATSVLDVSEGNDEAEELVCGPRGDEVHLSTKGEKDALEHPHDQEPDAVVEDLERNEEIENHAEEENRGKERLNLKHVVLPLH